MHAAEKLAAVPMPKSKCRNEELVFPPLVSMLNKESDIS